MFARYSTEYNKGRYSSDSISGCSRSGSNHGDGSRRGGSRPVVAAVVEVAAGAIYIMIQAFEYLPLVEYK